ncbi:MAG: Para-nitrobenzyl esterase [Pseudomonadota bacterium]
MVRDLRYGLDVRHFLDVFTPAQTDGIRPILVFVHGGAFIRGDRRVGKGLVHDNIAIWAVSHGMIGVNITYRLAPEHPWPSAQHDIRLALEWLQAHAAEWGGDASRIVLMGHSAGAAHVAQYLAFAQFQPEKGAGVQAAVLLSGIFDPVTAEDNAPLRAYFGSDTSRYPALSAVSGLVASGIPLFIAYAELDPDDFSCQSRQLAAALLNRDQENACYRLQAHSHMSEIYSINTEDDALSKNLGAFIHDIIFA